MAFLFSCYTGLRYSELTALKWADVRENEKIPYIKITEKKTKKERIVQLHEYPLSIIQKITRTQPDEKVFALPNNQKANESLRAWVSLGRDTLLKNQSLYQSPTNPFRRNC